MSLSARISREQEKSLELKKLLQHRTVGVPGGNRQKLAGVLNLKTNKQKHLTFMYGILLKMHCLLRNTFLKSIMVFVLLLMNSAISRRNGPCV